jgi:hypothetical protein
MAVLIDAADPRLSYYCPQAVDRSNAEVKLERFPVGAYEAVRGNIGATANLRSSSGCAVLLRTDSPRIELHLAHMRHHQWVPVGTALEVEQADGSWLPYASPDIRELSAAVSVRFATGLERGSDLRTVILWMPLISTCAVAGVSVCEGSVVEAAEPPQARWLAIGDSFTQGFSVQCPTQCWVHRLVRRWDMAAWNLGVAGIEIVPAAFEWALSARRWELVTIGLGSNHSWNEEDAATAADRAEDLASLALSGGHQRVVWLLPPYKPAEEGKGPPFWANVPLNRETGDRVRRVREAIRERLSAYEPRLTILGDLAEKDYRLYPDGLHPFAVGHARFAENLATGLDG